MELRIEKIDTELEGAEDIERTRLMEVRICERRRANSVKSQGR
jgi:hypothetical protein